MTPEMIDILQVVLPAVAAAAGSVVATKVSVARLQSDVKVLFGKVDKLSEGLHEATLEHAREYGNLKAQLVELRVKVNKIGAPWQRNNEEDQ